jgi:cation diffusion facilitator family transporter
MAATLSRRLGPVAADLASRAALLSFSANLALMVLKLVAGLLTGSVAVLSDGIDSAQDAAASALAFATIRWAANPPDEEHPYGHGKAESLAAGAQGMLIAAGAALVYWRAVDRLVTGEVAIELGPAFATMLATAAVNAGVLGYVLAAAKRTGSVALRADSRHLMTNIAQAASILAALGLVGLTGVWVFDPLVAVALGTYLAWSGVEVFRGALPEVMDVALPSEEVRAVEDVLAAHRGPVRGYHRLRTRKSGRQRYVDMHMLVDPAMSVNDAHDLCERVEHAIRERLPGAVVTIHVEPDDGRYRGPFHAPAPMRSATGDDPEASGA